MCVCNGLNYEPINCRLKRIYYTYIDVGLARSWGCSCMWECVERIYMVKCVLKKSMHCACANIFIVAAVFFLPYVQEKGAFQPGPMCFFQSENLSLFLCRKIRFDNAASIYQPRERERERSCLKHVNNNNSHLPDLHDHIF